MSLQMSTIIEIACGFQASLHYRELTSYARIIFGMVLEPRWSSLQDFAVYKGLREGETDIKSLA